MAMKWKILGLTRKLEIVCLYVKKWNRKVAWINFNITYDTEKQSENMASCSVCWTTENTEMNEELRSSIFH
jgi:hypothetical protein